MALKLSAVTTSSEQSTSSQLREMAMPGVHSAARRLLENSPRGTLIELGAGEGPLSAWAVDKGFDVVAVDINADNFRAPGVRFVQGDLNSLPLSFLDESADVVVCLEVIEHLENPFALLREVSRLLRPGGRAILSTPNETNLCSRLSYFASGFFSDASYVMKNASPDEHYYPHINCLPLPTLEYAWRKAGLEMNAFECSRSRAAAWFLLPFLAPLQWFRLATRHHKKQHADRTTETRVYRMMNDPRVLTGRILVFELQKPNVSAIRAAA